MTVRGVPHGTRSGFSYHKCRCFQCRLAQANYQRQYRERRIKRERNATYGVHHYQTKHEMTYRGVVQKYDGAIREIEARLECLQARANAAQKDSAA